jgi:DNA-binding transcriptional regulator YdaS (Cro superfamily)
MDAMALLNLGRIRFFIPQRQGQSQFLALEFCLSRRTSGVRSIGARRCSSAVAFSKARAVRPEFQWKKATKATRAMMIHFVMGRLDGTDG